MPGLQLHAPATHWNEPGQTFPHPPQFLSSNFVFTHVPPQSVVGAAHAQAPPLQAPLGHTLPQAPQLFGSLAVS